MLVDLLFGLAVISLGTGDLEEEDDRFGYPAHVPPSAPPTPDPSPAPAPISGTSGTVQETQT